MSRTRSLVVLPAALTAALLLASCSSTDSDATANAADGSEVALVEEGQLTVCTNPPYEPFEFEEDGVVVGLDMDIMQEVASDLGVEFATVITPFETIQSGGDLAANTCDVVASGITITEERKARIDFSEPYFDADQGLLVPEGSDLADIDGLEGKKVGVQSETTGATFAADNGLTIVDFKDLGLQVQALKTGQVDAVINDIAVLGPFSGEGLQVATTFPTGEQYGFGVKPGNTAMVDAINATLMRIQDDGTFDEIYTSRIGTAPSEG